MALIGRGLAAFAFVVAAPAVGMAQDLRSSVTHHSGRFGGVEVRYTATVADTVAPDAKGSPAAVVVTIAYTRDDVADEGRRPVMFLFNGGPGASSSPTHTQALGPMVRGDAKLTGETTAPLHENPYSPLDAVDLVFIDPVGTGFSHALPGVDPKPFYSVGGDAREVGGVISSWLRDHHREASPHFLAGESYGTERAAAILKDVKDLKFDGVLLIALVGDTPGNEMPFVSTLPTMAAGAWYHDKIDRAGRSVEQVYDEAVQFARTDYVTALIQGASLPPDRKRAIAARMAALTGLPVELILKDDLRVSKTDYMFNLLKDRGLRTGLLDERVTAPLEPGQIGDIDDPALGVAPTRKPGAPGGPPLTPAMLGPIPSPSVGAYLTGQLKFPASGPYIGINFTVNSLWDYQGRAGDLSAIGERLRADPHMRLFWAAGYFDLTTPAYAARYSLDQAGVPPGQLSANYFAGPHGVYAGEANLKRFDAAVRDFVLDRPSTGRQEP